MDINIQDWEACGDGTWRCRLCNAFHDARRRLRHERSAAHRSAVEYRSSHPQRPNLGQDQAGLHAALLDLLSSVHDSHNVAVTSREEPQVASGAAPMASMPIAQDETVLTDFDPRDPPFLQSSDINMTLDGAPNDADVRRLMAGMTRILNDDGAIFVDNDSETDSISRLDQPQASDVETTRVTPVRPVPHLLPKDVCVDSEWFPWRDKVSCTLDILMNLPRSVFSEKELGILFWILRVNGVRNAASVHSMKQYQQALQSLGGIDTIKYHGALGHTYFVNNLGSIISNELANPLVCDQLHWYPEDAGKTLNEAWQGSRWLNQMDPDLLTPMIRLGSKDQPRDFFIWEPTVLKNGDACIPIRWFIRNGKLRCRAYCIIPETINEQFGWVVRTHEQLDVAVDDLELNLIEFRASHVYRHLPSPDIIIGCEHMPGEPLDNWCQEPENQWRQRAQGRRVVSFMMWLYCDDTSGNVSKKWNKHNSFLFSAAGLPRTLQQQEYNVHFLCTSNLAPPLEMLDGIVEQLEKHQSGGIPAWHATWKEDILVIPSILAMLGDNPMQSEMACHMGMAAKLFCRICTVVGRDDAKGTDRVPDGIRSGGSGSDASSIGSARGKASRKRPVERLGDMVDRVRRFMQIGTRRTKEESQKVFNTIFDLAISPGSKTRVGNIKTEKGLKDTYQDFFLDRLFSSYKGKTGRQAEALLDTAIAKLPKDINSPVWRIKGLDPHRDTPVEILHVVLLGVVKYFWRDLVNRIKTDERKKEVLITRLSSLDVSGLGLSPLSGNTLVKYAGSLTGRDFRAIAQVAPFVIHGLGLSLECIAAWLALSAMVPLIWRPAIGDKDEYSQELTAAINHFLNCTARWTPRWFNKPKFHILIHLPEHILAFGPAMLFATESFESFNAVIRHKSVHTNRLAPSRDIGHGFAQNARIRHVLSGGLFPIDVSSLSRGGMKVGEVAVVRERVLKDSVTGAMEVVRYQAVYRSAGAGVLAIASSDDEVRQYIGFPDKETRSELFGLCTPDSNLAKIPWEKTKSSHNGLPFLYAMPNSLHSLHSFRRAKHLILRNGDNCKLGDWILAEEACPTTIDPRSHPPISVGQVVEILQTCGSDNTYHDRADLVAIALAKYTGPSSNYIMPSFSTAVLEWRLFSPEEILCVINLQHNCISNQCDDSGSAEIIMEREPSGQMRRMINHQNKSDMILNTS